MTRAATTLCLGAALALAGCRVGGDPPVWRADCRPRPTGLTLEAAREAKRVAERRQRLRLREAAVPGTFLRELHGALDEERLAEGAMCASEVEDLGALLFEHEFGFADGLGAGKAATSPAGPFRRVHGGQFGGPETISCPSCHWVGGPDGAGSETDNVFLQGNGEHPASGDERNPPALVAPGVVLALAREMSHDLQQQRADLVRAAKGAGERRQGRLATKGVDFGVLRVSAAGEVDASGLEGIDADLVVKPFGWKGTLADFADFASEALQVHMGIQSDRLLASASRDMIGTGDDASDPDTDGMRGELRRGPFVALAVHLALLELPVIETTIETRQLDAAAKNLLPPTTTSFADDFARGRRQFHDLGCAGCHRPMMVLTNPVLEVDGVPPIDLARDMRQPGLRYDAALGGYPVWLFSDLKRHDMGVANTARHLQNGVGLRDYLTPRLWGMASSAPYLHDGRAPSIDYAIAGHDGEGAAARAAFLALPLDQRTSLRVYLMALRRAPRLIVP